MAMVKWHPSRLDREIDSLVKSFWGGNGLSGGTGWNPRVDVSEHEDRYEVTAEVPGLSKEDVSVTLEKGVLTISGEKKRTTETNEDTFRHTERVYGKFSRSFNVGDRVAADKISAGYKDGVLTVTLPKAEEVKPKAIEVNIS